MLWLHALPSTLCQAQLHTTAVSFRCELFRSSVLVQSETQRFRSLVRPGTPVQLEYFGLQEVIDKLDLADLGITVTDQPCLQYKTFAFNEVAGICDDPSRFLFYDPIHFTSRVHLEVADQISQTLFPHQRSQTKY